MSGELIPPPADRSRRSPFLLVWFVLGVGLVGLILFARNASEEIRVLFIGNSYTASNDLPGMVETLSESAGASLSVSVIAPGGAWLADHARSPDTTGAVSEGDYDVVVLQEQSMVPADPGLARDSTYPAAGTLARLAAAAGSDVVFFQTWGHRDGNGMVGHGTYAGMQDAINATYDQLKVRFAGKVAPAGEAWRSHFRTGSTLALHDADGSHPSVAGSYLAAAVLAATIADVDPAGFAWTGPLDEADARLLMASAVDVVSAGG